MKKCKRTKLRFNIRKFQVLILVYTTVSTILVIFKLIPRIFKEVSRNGISFKIYMTLPVRENNLFGEENFFFTSEMRCLFFVIPEILFFFQHLRLSWVLSF